MQKFFVPYTVVHGVGLGDELLATKNLTWEIDKKINKNNVTKQVSHNALIYHFIDPVSTQARSHDILNKEINDYYKIEISDHNLIETNYSVKTANQQITKKLACLTTIKKNFQHTHLLCNLIHPDKNKIEVIEIKNNSFSTFTINNYKEKKIDVEIINDIFLLHKIFHKTKIYKQDLITGFIELKLTDNDYKDLIEKGITKNNVLFKNFYNSSYSDYIPFQKKPIQSKISIIEWWNALEEPYRVLDFWKYKPIKNIETFNDYIQQFTNPPSYVCLSIIKYGFATASSAFYQNNINNSRLKKIDFINYRTLSRSKLQPLQETFKKILSSKFCIGAEGGYTHLALNADIPYLMVIPDVVVFNESKMLFEQIYKELRLRYSFRNLFFCTESDLDNDDLISIMDEKVNFLKSKKFNNIDWKFKSLSSNLVIEEVFSQLEKLYNI